MRPIMHVIGDISDTWERLGNALSPTPPFPRATYRIRLAGIVAPIFLGSFFISSYMFTKGMTLGIGFGFFGDPVISRGLVWLNKNYPNWQKLLEVRNTILKGVPTNAQLTITLLRTGESNKAPLPPPPQSSHAPPEVPVDVTDDHLRATGSDWPLNATKEELDEAMSHDPTTKHATDGTDIDAAKATKHGKKGSRVLAFFKGTTRATVTTAIGADRLKAKAGSDHAKGRLGVIKNPTEDNTSGPVEFKSRYHGTKGHVYLTTESTIPCVAFSADKNIEKNGSQGRENIHAAWSIPIGDITELRKFGGYGWKAKLVVGWALDREIADGLEIIDRRGVKYTVTAIALRDELFNRLCAMGGQKWASY